MLGSMFARSPPRGSCVDAQSTLQRNPYNRVHTGSGSVVCNADGQTRARCFWRSGLNREPAQKEVIMTSKREYYGSQDFFALDIPVT